MLRSGKNFRKPTFIFVSLLLLFEAPVYSAKKKSKSKGEVQEKPAETTEAVNTTDSTETSENAVRLPSNTKPRTYFYKIDELILAGVENGSPEAITEAMHKLHRNDSDYAENEKVLMNISASIMELLWPSRKITWETFSDVEINSYTGAINSVKNGVFDSSTGNVDFLSTVIPTLVLFIPNANQSAFEQCEQPVLSAVELRPDSVLSNYITGKYFEKKGNYGEAELFFKTAYEKSPKTLELILAYSDILVKNNKAAGAVQIISTVPTEYLDQLSVLKHKAYVYFSNMDYTEAETYVAKVLQQTPNDLDFLLFRARIFIEKNDYIHAVSLLDMYARQNDTNIDYLVLRARVQLDWSKNTAAATETIEKALRLYPQNENALMLATRISSITDAPVAGKYADELAEIVLEKNPQNTEALIYAMEGLAQRENWEEAYVISSKLLKTSHANPDVVLSHVTECIELKKNTEAFEVAAAAYAENPQNETILQAYILAYCVVNTKDASLDLINSLITSTSSKMKSYLYYRRSFLQYSEDNSLADLRSSLIANPRNSDALFRLYEIYYAKEDYRKAQYYLRQVVAINPNDSSTRRLNEALTQLIK